MEYRRPLIMPLLITLAAVVSMVNLLKSLNSTYYHVQYVKENGIDSGLTEANYEVQVLVVGIIATFLICAALLIAYATKRTRIVSIIAGGC